MKYATFTISSQDTELFRRCSQNILLPVFSTTLTHSSVSIKNIRGALLDQAKDSPIPASCITTVYTSTQDNTIPISCCSSLAPGNKLGQNFCFLMQSFVLFCTNVPQSYFSVPITASTLVIFSYFSTKHIFTSQKVPLHLDFSSFIYEECFDCLYKQLSVKLGCSIHVHF